jgi:hypothetical protein
MNIEFLNLLKSPQGDDKGRKEKTGGMNHVHMYMEMSQGHSLYSHYKE